MSYGSNPMEYKRNSRKRLTLGIERVMEGLEVLESPSPREVNRQMIQTFRELGTMREKIKKQDLNPENFKANHKYQMSKDKIKTYVDLKYNDNSLKDNKRIVEILQNRPLTTFYNPSQKLLFDLTGQVKDIIKNNKRKFGEVWEITPRQCSSTKLPVISPLSKKKQQNSPRAARLSKLITKLMVKNLGIRLKDKPNSVSPKTELKLNCVQVKTKMSNAINTFQSSSDEIIFKEEDYFSPEYIKYFSDIDNSLKVQKYIGQNSGKRRKINLQLSKINNI